MQSVTWNWVKSASFKLRLPNSDLHFTNITNWFELLYFVNQIIQKFTIFFFIWAHSIYGIALHIYPSMIFHGIKSIYFSMIHKIYSIKIITLLFFFCGFHQTNEVFLVLLTFQHKYVRSAREHRDQACGDMVMWWECCRDTPGWGGDGVRNVRDDRERDRISSLWACKEYGLLYFFISRQD